MRQGILVSAAVFSLGVASTGAFKPQGRSGLLVPSTLGMSDNSDMFGSGSPGSTVTTEEETPSVTATSTAVVDPSENNGSAFSNKKMKDEAAKLRQEAAELEIAMREEARDKGLSQEVIDKLLPMRNQAPSKAAVGSAPSGSTAATGAASSSEGSTAVLEKPIQALSTSEVRTKLGYLNTGDAIRITSELDRLKSRGTINLWNCKDVSKANYAANSLQLTSKTGIEPVNLRLDAVGFEYQKVFVIALGIATVCGLGSTFIGGQIGFLLGYASALFPILLVGIGSIAPQLIGDVLNKFKYATNAEEKAKYVRGNAAKFLVGYIMGLPMASFSQGGDSNRAEFFQLRPSATNLQGGNEKPQMRAAKFKQADIAPISVTCVAGPTAECMEYTVAGGSNPQDVNLLYELMNTVEPALSPDKVQNHIRWSVLTAHTILKDHADELIKLNEAFSTGASLEECIACIEGKK